MYWLPIALMTALSLATADALSKRALRKTDDLVVAWVREGYALPFLFIAFLRVPLPALDGTFWLTVVSMLPLEIIALLLYLRAIRLSPLSLTVPFLALSPVFIVFFAFVLLGERPSAFGLLGVFLIAAGAYALNSGAYKQGLLGPIKAAANEPGAVLMVAVALIYSVTSTLGKVAIQHSSPLFFGFFYPFVLTVILTAMAAGSGKLSLVGSRPWTFLAIGFFTALMIICHYTALSLTNVAYMIAVKRTSLIWSVLYGRLLFGETNISERLVGSAVMVAGVILISLF